MPRFRCKKCNHFLRMRHRISVGQKIYCPECGELVYEYAKPLYPLEATKLRKTALDEHGRKDNR